MLSAAVARDLPGPAGEAPRKNASSAAHDDCAERGGQAVLAALKSQILGRRHRQLFDSSEIA